MFILNEPSKKKKPVLERDIEHKCGEIANKHGWWHTKFVSVNNKGVPDRIFIRNGVVMFVEFKAPKKTPTKLQSVKIAEMQDVGAKVFVIDDVGDFKNLLLSFEEPDF